MPDVPFLVNLALTMSTSSNQARGSKQNVHIAGMDQTKKFTQNFGGEIFWERDLGIAVKSSINNLRCILVKKVRVDGG